MQMAIFLFTVAASLPAVEAANFQCAQEVFAAVGEEVWPGWQAAPFDALIIDAETEYAITSRAEIPGFAAAGRLGDAYVLRRTRTLDPKLLATFPALSSPAPVIVAGTAEATGKSAAEWVVTLLHEHFHQHQYSQPWYYERSAALGLARGDTTGMWMLSYDFPYEDPEVGTRYAAFTNALSRALRARGEGIFAAALRDVKARWRELREGLAADDYAYFRFQAWQEGVARYVELLVSQRAAQPCLKEPPAAATMDRIFASLDRPELARQKRVAFYAAGAAIALLLDETSPGWKTKYFDRPFEIESYFAP